MTEKKVNVGGRPQKYKTEDLVEALNEYIAKETPGKITISDLVKKTNYPIQAWRFNNEIREIINEMNQKLSNLSKLSSSQENEALLLIPNAEDIVNTNYQDKKKLIDVVQNLVDSYQYNLKKCLKLEQIHKEINRIKQENKVLEEEVNFYKEKLKEMTVRSSNSYEREACKLNENKLNVVEFSQANTTFKDLFD